MNVLWEGEREDLTWATELGFQYTQPSPTTTQTTEHKDKHVRRHMRSQLVLANCPFSSATSGKRRAVYTSDHRNAMHLFVLSVS